MIKFLKDEKYRRNDPEGISKNKNSREIRVLKGSITKVLK